jgi:hypothetical protein
MRQIYPRSVSRDVYYLYTLLTMSLDDYDWELLERYKNLYEDTLLSKMIIAFQDWYQLDQMNDELFEKMSVSFT